MKRKTRKNQQSPEESRLRIGYLAQAFPYSFHDTTHNRADGLLPEIMRIIFQTLRKDAQIVWRPIHYSDLESAFDGENPLDLLVWGIETPLMLARASFIGLGLPFVTGMNAVTADQELLSSSGYPELLGALSASTKGYGNFTECFVIEGEMASHFYHGVLQDLNPTRIASVEEADPAGALLAEEALCNLAVSLGDGRQKVLATPLACARGGIYLPRGDAEWAHFWRDALRSYFSCGLPHHFEPFMRFEEALMPLIRNNDDRLMGPGVGDWLKEFWPTEGIDVPTSWLSN